MEVTLWKRQTYNRNRLNVLIVAVPPLPVTREIWELYGQTKAELSKVGKIIPDIDLLIAATAKHHQITLTANDKHRRHLPSSFLRKNWAAGEY
ncbi:MAG: type II toxin-antitoxin system VapC family toxin [Chlorobium sp.]